MMKKEYKAMKLSEVMEQLKKAMEEYGDLEVMGTDNDGAFVAIGMEMEVEESNCGASKGNKFLRIDFF